MKSILSLVQALLPVGAEIMSLFVHNPKSQNTTSMILTDIDTGTAIANAVMNQAAATQAATTAAAAPAATPAASATAATGTHLS
jgi:hypothetical protein